MDNTAIGPQTYLMGQILPALMEQWLRGQLPMSMTRDEVVDMAIATVDRAMEKMQWPDGRP